MAQAGAGKRRGVMAAVAALAVTALGGFAVLEFSTDAAVGGAKPVEAARAAPAPDGADITGSIRPAELQPTQHARSAGLRDCLPGIDEVSRLSVTGNYTAVSTWNAQEPNGRLFNSVVGQTTDSKVSPRAVSVVVTSPTAGRKCDATAVEIHPSTLSCPDIERTLAQDRRAQHAVLAGMPMLQADPSLRTVLVPAPAGGCIVVGVRTLYGK